MSVLNDHCPESVVVPISPLEFIGYEFCFLLPVLFSSSYMYLMFIVGAMFPPPPQYFLRIMVCVCECECVCVCVCECVCVCVCMCVCMLVCVNCEAL